MAVNQADVDMLESVIMTGVLTVRFDGPPARQVTYQSLRDMEMTLARMKHELATQTAAYSPYRLAATRKGL